MSREARPLSFLAPLALLAAPVPLAAQEVSEPTAEEALEVADEAYGPPARRCAEQDAADISQEIIVCARRPDQDRYRIASDDEAEARYARETMYEGDPQAPNVAGPGIFTGPPTVSGMCVVPPCPPPPVIMIDIEALPEAPPGSDADRVGRGLAPRGDEEGSVEGDEAE